MPLPVTPIHCLGFPAKLSELLKLWGLLNRSPARGECEAAPALITSRLRVAAPSGPWGMGRAKPC